MSVAEGVKPEEIEEHPDPEPDDPEPDDPEPDDPEPEPEPEPAPAAGPSSDKEMQKALAKLEAEAHRHANRVSEIMGEDAQELVPCPLCAPNIPGFRFPVPTDDETRAAVLEAIGLAGGENLLPADNARECEACKGLGKRLSGSKVPVHREILCDQCKGNGYIPVTGPGAPPPIGASGQVVQGAPQPVGEELPEIDPWGRAATDPDYGRLPNYTR